MSHKWSSSVRTFLCLLLALASLIGVEADKNDTFDAKGCSKVADVIFVIDSSLSVRRTCPFNGGEDQPAGDNWSLILEYVAQVTRAMPIGSNRSSVGVVTFSNKVDTDNVIALADHQDAASISDRILQLPYIGRNTNVSGALRYAYDMLNSSSRHRIIVLLTDGISNVGSDPIKEARLIKMKGVKLFVVGVSEYIDRDELREIASHPADYSFLEAKDFQHLNLLVSETLDRLVCSDPPPTQPCFNSRIDVAFVLDSSGSITDGDKNNLVNWNLMKNFVITLIQSLEVSNFQTHVALIQYSHTAQVIFNLDAYFDSSGPVEAINQMENIGSSTATAEALKVMLENVFSKEKGAREGVSQVGIVITDGQSNEKEETAKQAKAAKAAGIDMFAIGLTDNIDKDELKAIASTPFENHFFVRPTYALVNTVTSQLLWSVCHSTCSPGNTSCSDTQQLCASGQRLSWIAYPGHLVLGFSHATLQYVDSADQCKSWCLQDSACRSIEYISSLESCSMSYYTKELVPATNFRADTAVDYYELTCIADA